MGVGYDLDLHLALARVAGGFEQVLDRARQLVAQRFQALGFKVEPRQIAMLDPPDPRVGIPSGLDDVSL